MRKLKEEELEKIHSKITKFISEDSYNKMFDSDSLLLHNQKIFFVNSLLQKHLSSVSRKELVSAGSCIGKFTKTNQFRQSITALNLLASFALNKIWLKGSAEMNFLYGNNVLKSHVLKMSDDIALNSTVFVFNQHGYALGFGVASKSSGQYALCGNESVVVIVQSDCGEYLRDQDIMF